ncbi:MAG: class I SAM-dependent methyltransferase [Bacteroidetes bacterium]|nr:class I SAM-dependent methyltransferase [Bacteroidota bacterium]
MLEYARQRGVEVQNGVAENLSYENESFDFAVLINSICFIDNPEMAVKESYRILKNEEEIIIAILDKENRLWSLFSKREEEPVLLACPLFSVPKIRELLEKNKFRVTQTNQTLENPATSKIENPVEGYGKDSFVVIKGVKV